MEWNSTAAMGRMAFLRPPEIASHENPSHWPVLFLKYCQKCCDWKYSKHMHQQECTNKMHFVRNARAEWVRKWVKSSMLSAAFIFCLCLSSNIRASLMLLCILLHTAAIQPCSVTDMHTWHVCILGWFFAHHPFDEWLVVTEFIRKGIWRS